MSDKVRYWKNPELCREYNRKYRQTHRDYIRAYSRSRAFKESLSRYRKKNRLVIAEKIKTWRCNNKNRVRIWNLRRRTNCPTISIGLAQRVYEDNINIHKTLTCYLCEKPIEFGQDSLEHKIPVSRGGTNEYSNLAVAHISCNSAKGKKTLEEFLADKRAFFIIR